MATGPYNQIFPQTAAKLKEALTEAVQATAATVGARIVDDTPVDTGRARANWHALINSDNPPVTDDADPSGNAAKQRIEGDVRRARLGDAISIANGVPYIEYLEAGSSQQAPAGMVARNRGAVVDLFNRNLRRLMA